MDEDLVRFAGLTARAALWTSAGDMTEDPLEADFWLSDHTRSVSAYVLADEHDALVSALLKRCASLESAARESLLDAACFRFWVSEAARSPCDMARLIRDCVTEEDYRRVILPCLIEGQAAIEAAGGAS